VLNLGPKAWVASGYIVADVAGHVWPPVVPRDEFQGLELTRMSGDPSVMAEGDNSPAEV